MNLPTILIVRAALLLALVANPFLLARHLAASANVVFTMAICGAAAIGTNFLLPLMLQYGGVPLSPRVLACAHWTLFVVLIGAMAWRRLPLLPGGGSGRRAVWLIAAAFAVLVIPFTHLAGIDTYKWVDLATNVRVAQRIPWLIHPLALLGFGPRSYPSAQPLLLATVQILGGLGVDWGYYLASLVSGICGIFGAAVLGRLLLGDDRGAAWFAFLYAFSPVFLRYNHWATGRGFLVSLLPLFIYSLFRLPRVRAVAGVAVLAGLLVVSHKVGLVAVAAIPVVFLIAWLLPYRQGRWLVVLLLLLALCAARVLTPTAAKLLWHTANRFGLAGVLALAGLLATRAWRARWSLRGMLLAGFCTFPLACADMYGALIAVPFVTFAAAVGVARLRGLNVRLQHAAMVGIAVTTVVAGLAVLGYRSYHAASPAVYETARFLEVCDPLGPYRVEAPERVRKQIQAYVSGCPRFDLARGEKASVVVARRPGGLGSARAALRKWTAYGRNLIRFTDVDVAWYGKDARVYYVVVGGEGRRPPDAQFLFRRDDVELFVRPRDLLSQHNERP